MGLAQTDLGAFDASLRLFRVTGEFSTDFSTAMPNFFLDKLREAWYTTTPDS
jgi:hypothetical protein